MSRRITYCYADLSGMEKIKMKSCRALNAELTKRLEAFFFIFRHQFPKKLHYHFSALENDGIPEDEKHGNDDGNIVEAMSDEHINGVFDQEGDVQEDVPPKLKFLRQIAEEIAERSYTDVDCSMKQLTKNLISIIGQKSVEMNLLAKLATLAPAELRTYFNDIFSIHDHDMEKCWAVRQKK